MSYELQEARDQQGLRGMKAPGNPALWRGVKAAALCLVSVWLLCLCPLPLWLVSRAGPGARRAGSALCPSGAASWGKKRHWRSYRAAFSAAQWPSSHLCFVPAGLSSRERGKQDPGSAHCPPQAGSSPSRSCLIYKKRRQPWLVWLSGWSTGL